MLRDGCLKRAYAGSGWPYFMGSLVVQALALVLLTGFERSLLSQDISSTASSVEDTPKGESIISASSVVIG